MATPSFEKSGLAYEKYWQNELEEVDDTDRAWDILCGEMGRSLDRIKARLPGLGPAFGFLYSRTTGRRIPPDSSRVANPQILDALLENYAEQLRDFPAFRSAQSCLPDLSRVREGIERIQTDYPWSTPLFRLTDDTAMMASEHEDLVYAPALAAVLVVSEDAVGQDLARQLRGARPGHLGWFDRTLELAQCIAFGLREADRIQQHLAE